MVICYFAIYGLHERPLDGMDKKLGCVCPRCSTTDEINHSTKKDEQEEFSVGEWFDLKPLNAIRDVVYVVRSNYSAQSFELLQCDLSIPSISTDSTEPRRSTITNLIVRLGVKMIVMK